MYSIQALRKSVAIGTLELTEKASEVLDELQDYAENIKVENDRLQEARDIVLNARPVFVYLDEYPDIRGSQNLGELVRRIESNEMETADYNFMKLMKVAGLDPTHLRQILDAEQGAEERQLLTDRASAMVTERIRELWKDRELTVHFSLDADHFNILISDPTSVYPVKVNLDERSRGFRWFFSFFITFAADTEGGPAANAIILLDEPGLYLHATAQADLLKLFKNDFNNQIIYTTHSPFMISVEEMDSIRTVNISHDDGTTVSNDPTGDSRTLFPLQSALGYTIAQTLFVGATNVVVEGVTDFWYLSAASDMLAERGLIEGVMITPGGGAQKVSYLVALLTAEQSNVVVLFDSEKNARSAAEELARDRLLQEKDVVFVGDAYDPARKDADIEDLLDPEVFHALVDESYAKELDGKTLNLNINVPRIVKRYELAFEELGLEFNKIRPARLFLKKIGSDPTTVLGADVLERFAIVFAKLNSRLARKAESGSGPFGYNGLPKVVLTGGAKAMLEAKSNPKEGAMK
jgi:hypothetical protein